MVSNLKRLGLFSNIRLAQRPCSRCLGNGKADSCVDVQHKKRGRPRLRDDRDARYDPTRFPHPQDAALRRPLSIYPSGSAGPGYEDSLRPSQSHRVLKSYPSEPMAPRYPERGSAPDANVYAAPMSIGARPPEHVAYLSLDMEFSSASQTFIDAIGENVRGRKLIEILLPVESERAMNIHNQLVGEQKRREPNYLPPILGRGDQIMQGLGFSSDDVARFHLDRHEYLTFVGADGHPRHYPVRLGLAKEESYFFVVMMLVITPRYPYHSPQQHSREPLVQYHPQPTTPQSAFSQHAAPAAFDQSRQRFYEGPNQSRQLPAPPGQMSRESPGINPGASSYPPPPSRPEYQTASSYHVPRSELPPVTHPGPQPSFQLPPIRSQFDQSGPSRDQGWQRDDRSGRVDIGGLLEKPDRPGRPQ